MSQNVKPAIRIMPKTTPIPIAALSPAVREDSDEGDVACVDGSELILSDDADVD
jgi:hypothetical protein